jgi:predicted nucleic acid-binding protein
MKRGTTERFTAATYGRSTWVKMRVLIDTNVILDVVFNRKQFYAAAARVMTLAAEGQIEGFIAAHAVTTVYYLVHEIRNGDGSSFNG